MTTVADSIMTAHNRNAAQLELDGICNFGIGPEVRVRRLLVLSLDPVNRTSGRNARGVSHDT